MIIAVSGSPGTGKTTVAKELAKKLKYKYLDVNALIKERGLSSGHDDVRNCEIIAVDVLNNELADIIKEDCGFVRSANAFGLSYKDMVNAILQNGIRKK